MNLLQVLTLISAALQVSAKPVDDPETVSLSYGTFKGFTNGAVISFLGMPFAKPPTENLRFRLPEQPNRLKDIQNATAFGAACPQQVSPTSTPSTLRQSEDCLFVNVVRPANIPKGKKLPVVFWIYGGGFEDGDTSLNNGNSVVSRSLLIREPVVYVSANYRVNAFGFLAGKEVKAARVGNLGLQDQRFALRWTQKYIESFGGDAKKVVIWGESAGAYSIGAQLVTNNGNPEGLFRGAVMESGSPFNFKTNEAGQPFYDDLVRSTNCSSARDTLNCLRHVPFNTLLAAIDATPSISGFMGLQLAWTPRVDGDFLKENPQDSVAQGRYARVPLINGDCDDEGTVFTLSQLNLTTSDQALAFIKSNYLTTATDAQIQKLGQLYPDDPTQGSPFDTGTRNVLSPEYKRLAAIQGDLVFQAARRFFLRHASKTQDVWSYLWKRQKATPNIGSFHGSDLTNFYGSAPQPNDFVAVDALIHFVNSLNPNTVTNGVMTNLSTIFWPKFSNNSISDSLRPPLLTFSDPVNVSITPDTYREEAMDFLIELNRQQGSR